MQISNIHLTGNQPKITFHKKTDTSNENKNKTKQSGSLKSTIQSYTQKAANSRERIENLESRRQDVQSRRAEYVQDAKSRGLDQQTINAQLAEYDSEISQIDQQIAQIKQEDSKKATENASKNSGTAASGESKTNQDGAVPGMGSDSMKSAQKTMESLVSQQSAQEYIGAVQSAQKLLKTEALSYKPSNASAGNPEKYASLEARADGLENKIQNIEKEMQDSAKVSGNDQTASSAEEKTAQERAVENYKDQTGIADAADDSDTDKMDIFA
jgi:hypothetical protein